MSGILSRTASTTQSGKRAATVALTLIVAQNSDAMSSR